MNVGELQEKRSGSVKATANMFSERVRDAKPALKKVPGSHSERPSSRRREKANLARGENGVGWSNESGGGVDEESMMKEAEVLVAKSKVNNDLNSRIEQSNSRARAQMEYLEKLKKSRRGEGRRSKSYPSVEVMEELEIVKRELNNLKLEMASLLEEKRRAEKETEASNLKARSCSTAAEALKGEIEEINEEHVLAELARIEAIREYGTIKSQRKNDAEKHAAAMEESRRRMDDMHNEIDASKDLATKLAMTASDINMLEGELKQIKEIGDKIEGINETVRESGRIPEDGAESNDPELLHSITKEIESAKKELDFLREEGFKFMGSMDIIRTELKNVSAEKARAKEREEKVDLTIQNLNAKLLRGKAKLEAASLAEEKAKSIVSNLSRNLEILKTEAETARKETALINEETATMKAEIDKTESEIDLAEEELQVAIKELKSIKSSEAKALEDLQGLIENKVRSRASASKQITISNFEYEYLRGRAAGAEEIADKKVAAAQAWIEALKASEKEILIKIEMAKKENGELRIEEEQQVNRMQRQSFSTKERVESEPETRWQNREKAKLSRTKSANRNGNFTPSRRGKTRKSASPALRGTPRSASFTVKRRTKVMPNLAKFFSGNGKSSKEQK